MTSKIKWVTFGDSITWYDKEKYLSFTKEPNKPCIGYQSYLEKDLNIDINNQGVSGDTTQDVYQRSRNFDYRSFDGVSFLVGVNNFNKMHPKTFGKLDERGSVFNLQTFCGAYQAMIEDILTRYPTIQIFLISPYKVSKKDKGTLPEIYHQTIQQISERYNLPFCNLYVESEIDPNQDPDDFVDDYETSNYYLHINNTGYKKISKIIVPFFKKHLNHLT